MLVSLSVRGFDSGIKTGLKFRFRALAGIADLGRIAAPSYGGCAHSLAREVPP